MKVILFVEIFPLSTQWRTNRSWHLPGNPKQAWHPDCIMKEGACVDLSMDTMHLNDPL